jgi:hypothetical protein
VERKSTEHIEYSKYSIILKQKFNITIIKLTTFHAILLLAIVLDKSGYKGLFLLSNKLLIVKLHRNQILLLFAMKEAGEET